MKALFLIAALAAADPNGCDEDSSDSKQSAQQETILQEATAQTGMPAIHNFRERKLLKTILELRDQADLNTFTYTYAENTGKRLFLCNSIGYGLPYATQYTNPQKVSELSYHVVTAQADPNGLFSPASAEGTWVMCKDPSGPDVKPVYVEPRIIVSPFQLDEVPLPPAEPEAAAAKPKK